MKDNPILTIITVNLNKCDGLQRTINSVVDQTFTNYEWIVIDGGSTDGSRELIEKYADIFAYWCSEPDKGIYNAMNKGIAHAKGEWLQFLNSGDCLFENTTLDKVFNKNYKSDILYGDAIDLSSSEKKWLMPHFITISFLKEYALCHQSMFFRKEIFYNHKYEENYKICSDWALYYKLAIENYTMQYVPYCIAVFEGNGISNLNYEYATRERQLVIEKYTPVHLKKDLEYICTVKAQENYINSHKSYKITYKIARKTTLFLGRIINIIEWIKIKINK